MFDFFKRNKNKQTPAVNLNPEYYPRKVATDFKNQITNVMPGQTVIHATRQTPGTNTPSPVNPNIPQSTAQPTSVVKIIAPKVTMISANTSGNTQPAAKAFTEEELKNLELVNNLVISVLGYSVADIEEVKRETAIMECLRIFNEYMIKYVELKFGQQQAIRLKAVQQFNNPNIFTKFSELSPNFDEAYNSFLQTLEQKWEKVTA